MEKSRSLFRKHFDETGQRHPDCPPDKHSALLAWWTSLVGSSRFNRMKGMNDEKMKKRLSLTHGGYKDNSEGGLQVPRMRVLDTELFLMNKFLRNFQWTSLCLRYRKQLSRSIPKLVVIDVYLPSFPFHDSVIELSI
ncbi:hypothetical protein M758_UG197900 [Ceratodon purpureus]|nr:hypothetical protein M758_UG197900 [Ceratodon purpureus]